MASMWRRAMVYLGLQDDDELDYGGDYEPYGDYGDPPTSRSGARRGRDPSRRRRRPAPASAFGHRAHRAPEARADYATDYGAPEPAPAPAPAPTPVRAVARDEPSGMSAPRPAVVRTIGPTTAARVHVVEPQGFNDAQEVGDRLKANQPVILNLQGLPAELQRRLIDFSSGLAYAVGGTMAAGRRPGLPAHADQRRGLPGGEGPAAGPRPVPALTVRSVLGSWSPST